MSASSLSHHRVSPQEGWQLDQTHAYRRLDSGLYGALTQVTTLAAATTGADLAACRVFEDSDDATHLFATGADPRMEPMLAKALWAWPTDEGSLFEVWGQTSPCDGVYRPQELTHPLAFQRQGWFARLDPLCDLGDVICVSVTMQTHTKVLLVLMNRASSPDFNDVDLRSISHLRPGIAKQLYLGLQTDRTPQGAASTTTLVVDAASRVASLSRTERHVLHYLRCHMTERQIAGTLERSPHTVHVHVKSIYRKFNVTRRKKLLALFDTPSPQSLEID